MRNDFNWIAPLYDLGVRIIFGREVYHAYTHYLDRIQANQKVLVVGGGSGKMLPHISDEADIHYVELSAKMLLLAKSRRVTNLSFYQEDFLNFDYTGPYDWIIFPFFLDLFSEAEIGALLQRSHALLSPKGRLIISDFELPRTRWQNVLIRSSIFFLKPLVSLKIKRLAPIRKVVASYHYQETAVQTWNNGFIFSAIFEEMETFSK